MYPVKHVGETDYRGTVVTFSADPEIFKQTTEYSYETLSNRLRELSFLNKGVTLTIIDKREKDEKGEFLAETFKSEEGLKEFIRFLDETREPVIGNVIAYGRRKKWDPC